MINFDLFLVWCKKKYYRMRIYDPIVTYLKDKKKPDRKTLKLLLQHLKPEFFKNYNPINGTKKLKLYKPSLLEYIEEIKKINNNLKEESIISRSCFTVDELTEGTIDGLFIHNNSYIAPTSTVETFKEVALLFCEKLEFTDDVHTGIPEYSLRLCKPILLNMIILTAELILVSLE